MSTKQFLRLNVKKAQKPGQKLVPVLYLMRNSSAEFLERLTGPSLSSTRHTHTHSLLHTIRKNGSYAWHQTTYCLYMYGTFRFRSFILWCLKGGFFSFFFGANVCVIKLRLFSLRCSRPAGLWSREGCSLGDVAALFVYEILWRDRICGSWWNKSLNQTKRAPLGNGKQLFEEGSHAHTCAGCLHWAATPLADAFQRSRWAHQIRIHIFTLD